jgi:VWFA-related protein
MPSRSLAPALLILFGAAVLPAQEPPASPEAPVAETPTEEPPTFGAEVDQVIVDMVVTDKDGNPVTGIAQDDLIVTEDGVAQTVVSFEAVVLPDDPAPKPPPPPRVSRNTDLTTRRGRTFAIVFDDMNLTPHRARGAMAAVASFLTNGVREGDYVTLIATSGAAWWTARMESGRERLMDTLKRLDGRRIPDLSMERLSDWEAMRIHNYQDPQVIGRVMRRFDQFGVMQRSGADLNDPRSGTYADPYVTARATDVYFQARTRNRVALEVLERALNGMASAKGRKSVILVSDGFIYDPALDEFKRVNAASRRANAAIYFLNARGLEGMPTELTAAFGPPLPARDVGFAYLSMDMEDDGSETLASESGGFTVKNTNDLEAGIQRIAQETQIYYLLGYNSTNTARDGAFREIKVKFRKGSGKDLKIRARKGYYAPTADGRVQLTGKEGVDPVLQAALDSPWPEDDIPLRMTHFVGSEGMLGKASVLVVAEVDVRAIEFQEVEGRHVAEIEFLLVTAHRESGEFFRFDETIKMNLRPATHERLERLWLPIIRDFQLQPGDHMAKMIVREKGTGAVGTLVHVFEVPPLEEFRVTTPIISDVHKWRTVGQGFKAQPLARREFPQGEQLLCQFDVLGAAKDESGMPKVLQGYEVRGADGSVLVQQPGRVINPTSLGALSRQFGFPLEVPLGDYEIVMTVRDELAGKELEIREPFTVMAPPPEPPVGSAAPQTAPPP